MQESSSMVDIHRIMDAAVRGGGMLSTPMCLNIRVIRAGGLLGYDRAALFKSPVID
jgi:hypothetical protein